MPFITTTLLVKGGMLAAKKLLVEKPDIITKANHFDYVSQYNTPSLPSGDDTEGGSNIIEGALEFLGDLFN